MLLNFLYIYPNKFTWERKCFRAAVLDYEEFQSRNIRAMALLVQRIKEVAPETRSRHSNQAWINSESWRTDRIISDIQLR